VKIRQSDATDPSKIHPLLMTKDEVAPFPSATSIKDTLDFLCKGNHRYCNGLAPEGCFMYYAEKSDPSGYGPSMTRSFVSYPFDKSTLPGNAPILEHIRVMLADQAPFVSGGTFEPFVKETIKMCASHRQVSNTTQANVRTIIFGVSTDSEVTDFIDAFNQKVLACAKPPEGHLPSSFYSLDIESATTPPDVPFRIFTQSGGESCKKVYSRDPLPARIHLGFYDDRFDIVFPWTYTTMSDSFKADYKLLLPDTPLSDVWHDLFSKLSGYGIGIGLDRDISILNFLLSSCYSFESRSGPVQIKTVDLLVLLALAGYNSPKTCLSVLNYIFTGGIIQKNWRIRCGFGDWATTQPLKPALNLYLQSEAYAALNAANIASVAILIHWFVTPGIAAVISRKTPVKFLAWFSRFIVATLEGAKLPKQSEFNNGADRVHNPQRLVAEIQYESGHTPLLPPTMIAQCIPPWRNVTGGGCASDQLAFDHWTKTLWPMLRSDKVPRHLRWESDLRIIDGFLTGKPSPSAKSAMGTSTGCGPDSASRVIPAAVGPGDPSEEPLRNALRKYRAALPIHDELKRSTVNQLLLLYTWQHPQEVIALFEASSAGTQESFYPEDYDLIRPLIFALCGKSDSPDPEFYLKFCRERLISQHLRHAKTLQAVDLTTTDLSQKRKHHQKFKQIQKKLRRLGVSLTKTAVSTTSEAFQQIENSFTNVSVAGVADSSDSDMEEGLSSVEDSVPSSIEEVRTVTYRDSPASEDASFEILIIPDEEEL